MQWNTSHESIGLYWSADHVIDIHGHEGRATLRWTEDVFDLYCKPHNGIDAVQYFVS